MKTKSINVLIFSLNAIASWANMVYFADNIAKAFGGYFFALGVIPFVVGLLTSCIGAMAFGKGFLNSFKEHWSILLSGELGEFLPILYVLIILS
jgi:hypothetical protein